MKQEIQNKKEWNPQFIMEDLQNTQQMCKALMNTLHYKKMGAEGIFAIVQKAKALRLNPMEALNGGMYCVQGKVEMSSNMMIQLVRQAGHSVTKDKRSDDTVCILHGKRKDNGDTWTESFSINDAKRAGIYKNTWEKFPRNMLFARALSNLARQLFPDVIGGCYVEGEISQSPPLYTEIKEEGPVEGSEDISYERITSDQVVLLEEKLQHDLEMRQSIVAFLQKQYNTTNLHDMPQVLFDKVLARIEQADLEEEPKVEEEL